MEANEVTIPAPPASDSLDDLMDFAFALKEAGHQQQALDAFRRALRLYRFSEAAPFLAIEIANLLKNKGAYDEAIAVLTEGRSLLALVENETLDQEFVITIAYLRIVKNTLLEKRVGYVPFSRIPAEISREIDAEFREWRNLA
jgi:tetratricopeptide (TPR) repeat protein